MTFFVTKMDGTKEPYNEDKIRTSAVRVGVPKLLQDQMLEDIRSRLYDKISTTEIFTLIKDFLHSTRSPYLATKYNLKDALSELGPSGYPFEKYVSLLLQAKGYECKINQILNGACVSHEVDIVAKKDGTTYFIEAKFHKSPHQRTDVRVALYIKARYDDLASAHPNEMTLPWLITNTRFSTDAIKYAECQQIQLTSWGYPKNQGIMDLIEETHLHPITMLEGLTQEDKMRLLKSGVVTCQQLLDPQNHALIPQQFLKNNMPELKALCQSAS